MRFAGTTIILLSIVLAFGCGSARRGVPLTDEHELTTPELHAGHRAFDHYCNQCHPGGEAGLGPSLNNRRLPGWLIRFQVRHGLFAMPAFSEEVIADDELDAIVAYLKYIRHLDARAYSPPPQSGS